MDAHYAPNIDYSNRFSILVQPGYESSGKEHWQTHWENAFGYKRIEQRDFYHPCRGDWTQEIERYVISAPVKVILVAHSLGCIAVAHWAMGSNLTARIGGALLVAPADVDSTEHTPDAIRDFAPIPRRPLPFRSTVIASRNDPFMPFDAAQRLANTWQSRFVDVGLLGHVNADSSLGLWPEGHRELLALCTSAALEH
jgi:predicted alpha/beta hydrolase family esterase